MSPGAAARYHAVMRAMRIVLSAALSLTIAGSLDSPAQKGRSVPEIPPYLLPGASTLPDDGHDPMSNRLFRTTSTRRQDSLGGFWDFAADPDDSGERRGFLRDFQAETQLWVPGSWNVLARYWQYQGTGWLRRRFETDSAGAFRIRFGGVFYSCSVWLDGELLGSHEGGYAPFSFVVPDLRAGRHSLTLRADNRLDDETLPKQGVDWFPYGGPHRPVYIERVPATFIEDVHVVPSEIVPARALLRVRVSLKNLQPRDARRKLELSVDGRTLRESSVVIPPGDSTHELAAPLEQPRLWSPDAPNLYSARVVLLDAERAGDDDQFTRFGVRSFSTRGNKILLNGKRFKLRGANRHDDHPDWGPALPPHLLRQDLEILKRMGANAVRGHYPPSEMFMDYCDSSGLVFLSEVPAWQYRPDQLAKEAVRRKIKQQFTEMVRRDMSHPSVFAWSLGNEWREFDRSYAAIQELVDFARRVDSTHFVTFVTGGAEIDRSAGLIDIISTNWGEYQWYDPITYLDAREGERSRAKLDEIHERFPDKPVILTEFGGAESQAGWHSWGNAKWSEEYQARNVLDSGKYALEADWISGGCVWQFCDTRTDPSRALAGRGRGWNTKGIVDAYRQPKMAFYELQQLFRGFASF